MCAVAHGMHAHMWSPPPPELKHTFVKNGRKQQVQHPECRYLEKFSFVMIWQPSSLWSDTNWWKTFMESFLLIVYRDLLPAENCSHTSSDFKSVSDSSFLLLRCRSMVSPTWWMTRTLLVPICWFLPEYLCSRTCCYISLILKLLHLVSVLMKAHQRPTNTQNRLKPEEYFIAQRLRYENILPSSCYMSEILLKKT